MIAEDIRVELREASEYNKTRRPRPRSASFVALRSALYQITCLSDFKLEKIGSGFFADVFKVQHRSTGEVMVLKMNKHRKNSKQMLSEIQLMNRLKHPNILKFKGSCVHEGQLHALTEYINSGSLEELLLDGKTKLSWSVRARIARDIARGMAYLHSKGVFHRDLNSKNCLIQTLSGGSLRTVVADFGLAARIKQRRRRSHTEVVGSPYWMAPECLSGKHYCEQADVFSFGITLAEIIARIPADPDVMPRTRQYGMDFEALRALSQGCPEELFQLMAKCCQIDPDDRPTFEELLEALEKISIDDSDDGTTTASQQLPQPEAARRCSTTTAIETIKEGGAGQEEEEKEEEEDVSNLMLCSFSEPILKLHDSSDDEENSYVKVALLEPCLLLHDKRLNSLDSSITSSCSSSGGGQNSMDLATKLSDRIQARESTTADDRTLELAQESAVSSPSCEDKSVTPQNASLVGTKQTPPPKDAVSNSDLVEVARRVSLTRRCSEGILLTDETPEKRTSHSVLQKTTSLTGERRKPESLPSCSMKPKMQLDELNGSIQTLVDENEDPASDWKADQGGGGGGGGGGDSGIDPGEIEIFKFPPPAPDDYNLVGEQFRELRAHVGEANSGTSTPRTERAPSMSACHAVSTEAAAVGDETPHCMSPLRLRPNQHWCSSPPLLYHSDHLVLSRTSSDEEITTTTLPPFSFTTPTTHPPPRSASPFSQSWASSEASFYLPPPSHPWAPPSSPALLQSRPYSSLPSSPTLMMERRRSSSSSSSSSFSYTRPRHASQQHHHRYSQDAAFSEFSSSAYGDSPVYPVHRKPSSWMASEEYSRTMYSDAASFDAGGGGSVRFDDRMCSGLNDQFSSLAADLAPTGPVHSRSRSYSNPQNILNRFSGSYSLTLAPIYSSMPGSSGDSPQHRVSISNTAYKCFNIRRRKDVRLSSSEPNLSALHLSS